MEDFVRFIKELRKEKKLSTQKLADLMGVSQGFVSQLENGRRKKPPTPDMIKKFADALDYDYYFLMRKAGYMESVNTLSPELLFKMLPSNVIKDITGFDKEDFIGEEGKNLIRELKPHILVKLLMKLKKIDVSNLAIRSGIDIDSLTNYLEDGALASKDEIDKIGDSLGVPNFVQWLQNASEWVTHYEQIDEELLPGTKRIYFDVSSYQQSFDRNGGISTALYSEEEMKRNFLSLENLLTMNYPLYFRNHELTQEDKEKLHQMIQIVLPYK